MKVKVISKHRQSALVEYTKSGKLQRVTIPFADIKDGEVSEYKLRMGIPYGVEWAKLIKLQATSEDLQENLRNAGIWTGHDARTNAQVVLGAIQKTYGMDLGVLLKVAKEADNG